MKKKTRLLRALHFTDIMLLSACGAICLRDYGWRGLALMCSAVAIAFGRSHAAEELKEIREETEEETK